MRGFSSKNAWPQGWSCPRCQSNKAYFIETRNLYECSRCHYQVSITSGTVLHKTRTSLQIWFMAMFLMITDKRGISSVGLARQLGITQKKAYRILRALRNAMGQREERYQLDGFIELDESFFGTPTEGGGRGRGTEKSKVLIGLSLDQSGKPRYLKMKVLKTVSREKLEPVIEAWIVPGSTVKTDGLRSYLSLPKIGYAHERIIAKETEIVEAMHWLHTAVSNLKALIGGTYHGLEPGHLQEYLDEFSYRFNRRDRPDMIFERLVVAVASSKVKLKAA